MTDALSPLPVSLALYFQTTLGLSGACTALTREMRARLSAAPAQTGPESPHPEALLRAQRFGDHVGQPHGQQDGQHEQDDGDLRWDHGQWEGPIHVDAEDVLQVTVAARGGRGKAMGHRLWGPHIGPSRQVKTEIRDLGRGLRVSSSIYTHFILYPL